MFLSLCYLGEAIPPLRPLLSSTDELRITGEAYEMLRETEPVSLGVVDLVVNPSIDTIREWPWGLEAQERSLKLGQML